MRTDYTESWTYAAGWPEVTAYTDRLSNKTTYTYTVSYRLPAVTTYHAGTANAYATTNTLTADGKNIASSATAYDDRTVTTAYTYDASYPGNVTAQTQTVTKDGESEQISSVTYGYDAAHTLVTSTTVHNVKTNNDGFTYTNAANVTTSAAYNSLGLPVSKTDARGNTTAYTYNKNGWITGMTTPDGTVRTVTYQIGGDENKVTVNNNGTYFQTSYYDGLGRVIKEGDHGSTGTERILMQYMYNAGQLSRTLDIGNNVTGYAYDGLGRITVKAYFRLGAMGHLTRHRIAYNDYDRTTTNTVDSLTSTILQSSRTTVDAAGRTVLEEQGVDTTGGTETALVSTSYTYDYAGRVKTTTTGGNTTSYTYNDMGQLTAATDALNRQTSYTYDLRGNTASVTTPGNKTVSYAYDTLNRLISTTDAANRTTRCRYDANGNRTGMVDNGSQAHLMVYDNMNRLTSKTSGSTSVSYTYDALGNTASMTDTTGTTTYTYWYDNTLASIETPDGKTSTYTNDPGSNLRTVQNYNGQSIKYYYTYDGQLDKVVCGDDTLADYTYTGGQLQSVTYENGSTAYACDLAGRLVQKSNTFAGSTQTL